MLELLGIDDRAVRIDRHTAAGITGTSPPGYEAESAGNAAAHDGRDLILAVRGNHHEGDLDAPVSRIRGMRDPGDGTEIHIVFAGQTGEISSGDVAELDLFGKMTIEIRDCSPRGL